MIMIRTGHTASQDCTSTHCHDTVDNQRAKALELLLVAADTGSKLHILGTHQEAPNKVN